MTQDWYPIRCSVCRLDTATPEKWWPVVSPSHLPCEGVGRVGLVQRNKRWVKPRLDAAPDTAPVTLDATPKGA